MEKSSNKKYIYESPDGGTTIFRRESGSLEREQIAGLGDYVEDDSQYQFDFGEDYPNPNVKEWTWWDDQHEWEDMKKVAKAHPALQAAIDHAIMIYKLSKEEDDNDEDLPF